MLADPQPGALLSEALGAIVNEWYALAEPVPVTGDGASGTAGAIHILINHGDSQVIVKPPRNMRCQLTGRDAKGMTLAGGDVAVLTER